MLELINSAETPFHAVVAILDEIAARRMEILPVTRAARKERERRLKDYRDRADAKGIGVDFDAARLEYAGLFTSLCNSGVDELDAAREIAQCIDYSFGSSFAYNLPNFYREFRADDQRGPGVYRMKPGDPVCASAAFAKSQLHASDHDEARAGGVRLAPEETALYDVEISFELSHLAAAVADPRRWRIGIVQAMSGARDEWVDGALSFQAAPVPADSDQYRQRIRALLGEADDARATFAVLAEGVVTDAVLADLAEQAAKGSSDSLLFAIAGSRYTPVPGDGAGPDVHENVAEIISFADTPAQAAGTRLVAARKNRRSFDGLEPIRARPDCPYIKIFSVGDVKLAVVICADFSEPRIRAFLSTLGVEFVAVPTMTMATANALEFARQASGYALDTGAVVVVANSSLPGRKCLIAGAVADSATAAPTMWRANREDGDARADIPQGTDLLVDQLSALGVEIVDKEFCEEFGMAGDDPSSPGVAVIATDDGDGDPMWRPLHRATGLAIEDGSR